MQDKQVDALVSFVELIKPYHTKIVEIEVEYTSSDIVRARIIDDLNIEVTVT